MSTILITILSITTLLAVLYILYLKWVKKYTRERFAFVGVGALLTLSSAVILQLYSGNGIFSSCLSISNMLLETKYEHIPTGTTDHVLSILILGIMSSTILRLYKNWEGPISNIQHEKDKFNESSHILADSLLQLKDLFAKEKKISVYVSKEKQTLINFFADAGQQHIPWHVDAAELLVLISSQYKIDIENDYYSEHQTFLSTYGQQDDPIAIYCCLTQPHEDEIRSFLSFIDGRQKEFTKLLILVKHGDKAETLLNVDGCLVTVRYQSEMLDSIVAWRTYREHIRTLFTDKDISEGSNITLAEMYVPSTGKTDTKEHIESVEDYIHDWLNQESNRQLAILAEYGCGKSVLSLKISYDLLQKSRNVRIPILIELRGKSPRNLSIPEILSNWCINYHINPLAIAKLHRAGRLLIILEGFDEMDMIGDSEMRLAHFQRLWEFAIPNAKILITGRPNFFLDNRELRVNLGIEQSYLGTPYCQAIYLEKFSIEQIQIALRNIDPLTKNQIVEILKKNRNANFYDLVSRPAILYLIAVIWRERQLSQYKENINSARVIYEFIQYTYARQARKPVDFPLTVKEREYFMLGIAVGMVKTTGFSNQIDIHALEAIILKLYKHFPDELTANHSATEPARRPLRQRMRDNNHAEETILTDVRSCGLLINDLSRNDYFKFSHKSYLEYLVSSYYVEQFLDERNDDKIIINSVSKALDLRPNSVPLTSEIIYFSSEILVAKFNLPTEKPKETCLKLYELIHPKYVFRKRPSLEVKLQVFVALVGFAGPLLAVTMFEKVKHALVYFPLVLGAVFGAGGLPYLMIPVKKKSEIWLNCCRQLQIPGEIVASTVSRNYAKFLRSGHRLYHVYYIRKTAREVNEVLQKLKQVW